MPLSCSGKSCPHPSSGSCLLLRSPGLLPVLYPDLPDIHDVSCYFDIPMALALLAESALPPRQSFPPGKCLHCKAPRSPAVS
jgi:hypothetical protein